MKVMVIGATGTIGSALVASLKAEGNDVIAVGRGVKPGSEVQLDYTATLEDSASIKAILETLGSVDAIVNFAGTAAVGKVLGDNAMTDENYNTGFQSKLMGQVNLVKLGLGYLTSGGSITLTTGETSSTPVVGMAAAAMVNAAVDAFVKTAALELTDGKRVNTVSPGMVKQSLELIPGTDTTGGIEIDEVVQAYRDVMTDSTINGENRVVTTDDNAIAIRTLSNVMASMYQ